MTIECLGLVLPLFFDWKTVEKKFKTLFFLPFFDFDNFFSAVFQSNFNEILQVGVPVLDLQILFFRFKKNSMFIKLFKSLDFRVYWKVIYWFIIVIVKQQITIFFHCSPLLFKFSEHDSRILYCSLIIRYISFCLIVLAANILETKVVMV